MTSSLYIHIPYCISKCIYCDFYSIPHQRIPDDFISALISEIEYRAKAATVEDSVCLESIYIGGGTPSLLTEKQIHRIEKSVYANFQVSDNVEFTIEVNPDDVTESLIKMLSGSKINRISCGLQSMNPLALEFAGRRGNVHDNRNALNLLRNTWKKNFSIDLICGLPEENEKSFIEGLKEIISYSPNHISMYSLTIEEETPLGKLFHSKKIEYDFDKADALWLRARKFLSDNDYIQYEVSNFAKTGYESRHNLRYWNHQGYIGCGAGATGTLYNSDGTGFRWTDTQDVEKYITFWSKTELDSLTSFPQICEEIDLKTSEFEFFMMGLRKLNGINETEFENMFHETFPDSVRNYFNRWQKKGLCEIINNQYKLTSEGILFLNDFLINFPDLKME